MAEESKQHYVYPVINRTLAKYAKDNKLNMEEMAAAMGIAKSSYYNKLNGYQSWTINDLCKIKQLTGITYEELVSDRQPVEHERYGSKSKDSVQ